MESALCMRRRECDKIHKMINSQSLVRLKRSQILQIAARNGVKRLRVFGSVARGTEDEQSDIDFLVELAPDRSLLDLGISFTRSALSWGRKWML